jgi:PhnB protein
MHEGKTHIRNGMGAVRPFVYGRLDLLDFVTHVFGAVELERNTIAGGFHVQARIGDSVLVVSAADPPYAAATRASLYVYVDDVDATYQRALAAGARGLSTPTDKPFRERTAGVQDAFGNVWYLATYTG